ncbi:MAG: YihY/virulence factor BrkB family protein [Eubacteriales bacterium]|nr:YihY/virulence factor BrkB family protein [Eubacteriales bacterium]
MAKNLIKKVMEIPDDVSRHHVGAYAAQAAYFFMLSMIPIILLLLTMVQYTPITKADVMTAVVQVFPSSVDSMITSIVNQVYNQSSTIIPITIIVALWSAGKGVLSISTGLNTIYGCPETRNYFYLRIRATLYTVLFMVVIILLLVMSVFGNSLNIFITSHIPAVKPLADKLIELRTIVTPIVLMCFSLLIYKFLPNRKDWFRKQIPGAVFSAIGWQVISWIFSMYLDIFKGFSDMYGSLTTIVLIMLWLYFCMYCILLGAVANTYLRDVLFTGKEKREAKEEL